MSRIRRTPADEPHLMVRTVGAQLPPDGDTGSHTHAWGQLIYCSAGVTTIWTEQGSWVAPPYWAVWAPPGVAHRIQSVGRASLRTLYLRAEVAGRLPSRCAVFTISPLLRELILRAVEIGALDDREANHVAMCRLIVDELRPHATLSLELVAPKSALTLRAATRLSASGPLPSTAVVAAEVGVSPRTLERRFIRETGLTVAAWGRQSRLLGGLKLLAAGAPVKVVAEASGYASPSAFVAAFRKLLGETPARYFARQAH